TQEIQICEPFVDAIGEVARALFDELFEGVEVPAAAPRAVRRCGGLRRRRRRAGVPGGRGGGGGLPLSLLAAGPAGLERPWARLELLGARVDLAATGDERGGGRSGSAGIGRRRLDGGLLELRGAPRERELAAGDGVDARLQLRLALLELRCVGRVGDDGAQLV